MVISLLGAWNPWTQKAKEKANLMILAWEIRIWHSQLPSSKLQRWGPLIHRKGRVRFWIFVWIEQIQEDEQAATITSDTFRQISKNIDVQVKTTGRGRS